MSSVAERLPPQASPIHRHLLLGAKQDSSGRRKSSLEPERVIPGNQMGFFGLPDARDRADLIAYLRDAAQRLR